MTQTGNSPTDESASNPGFNPAQSNSPATASLLSEQVPILPTATSKQIPFLTITASKGWSSLNLSEIWSYRDLLLSLSYRDIRLRYRQTALGAVWVVLQPLLSAGIFSFLFGVVAGLKSDGFPYFVFSFAGMLAWNVFSNVLSKTSTCLVGSSHLVSKVYFPRLVIPLSVVPSVAIDFLIASILLIGLMLKYHLPAHWGLLLTPVVLLSVVAMALGIGLFSAALMVSYRDVGYVLPVLIQSLMLVSPVAYSSANVPEKWHTVFMLNPMAGLVEAFRWSILGKGEISVFSLAYPIVLSSVLLIGGAFSFRRMERRFADVI